MRICVGIDDNAHFMGVRIENRSEVLNLLKNISGGDYWANESEEKFEELGLVSEEELHKIGDSMWFQFVESFIQRGTMEIVNLKD